MQLIFVWFKIILGIFFPVWGQIIEISWSWPSHPLIVTIIFISSIFLVIGNCVIIVIVILIVILMIVIIVITLLDAIHLVLHEGLAVVGVVLHVVAVQVLVLDVDNGPGALHSPLNQFVLFLRSIQEFILN